MPLTPPNPSLAADRIALRLPEANDAEWIANACNDPDIARFIPGMPSPYVEADAERFLEAVESGWALGTQAAFVIADAAQNEPLGMVTLHVAQHDPAVAGVGYWVRPEARGRGAATVAVRLIARWAFRELRVQRLHLTTAPDNVASQRVAERAGFIREGLLRNWAATADGRRDSVMFSLLPADLAETI